MEKTYGGGIRWLVFGLFLALGFSRFNGKSTLPPEGNALRVGAVFLRDVFQGDSPK